MIIHGDRCVMCLPKGTVLDTETAKEVGNMLKQPFMRYFALMPDCHATGFDMPIGGVLATKDVVVPSAVGVDIGCGITLMTTSIPADEIPKEKLKKIIDEIYKVVPVGFEKQKNPYDYIKDIPCGVFDSLPVVEKNYENSTYQIGTLGGGNHFLELQKGSDGFLYIMVHSGSRNLGKKVADHYIAEAKKLRETYYSSATVPFIPFSHGELARTYLQEMSFCLKFAYESRKAMLNQALMAVVRITGFKTSASLLNCHHNYCSLEEHMGDMLYVHRKGAIYLPDGAWGIIPGSMGTSSYIVRGKKTFLPTLLESASHGAGRVMSRREANKNITEEEANASMGDVVHRGWDGKYDESPLAYKDIDAVIDAQSHSLAVETRLTPLAVVKG